MHLFTLTKTCFITSIIPLSFIFGTMEPCSPQQKKIEPPICEQDYGMPGHNASSRINVCGCSDIYVSGSFIYWQPIQENMQLGIVSNNTNPLDWVNGDVVHLDFAYKPGFQIDIGMNFDYDNWDTNLQYTWLRGTHHIHTTLDPTNSHITLLPAWQIPDFLFPQYTSGSEKWKLHLDILDFDLARNYFVGQKLTFRPFFGARAAWIFQNIHVDYIQGNLLFLSVWPTTHISQSSHSWGVGPRTGLSTNWDIGKQFRLYGNAEADVLFTQYTRIKCSQISDTTSINRYLIRQKDRNYLRTHLELKFGLGWGSYFANNQWHIDLSADYGYQVFFDQNMFPNFVIAPGVGKNISPNGNLYIHGLTTTMRLDF